MKDEVFNELYRQFYKPLFLYAYSLCKDRSDAEDLVEETFIKAYLSFHKGSIQSWLYKVLQNEFYMLCRKRKKLVDEGKIDLSLIESDYNLVESLIEDDTKSWLYKTIDTLPLKEKEVMMITLTSSLNDENIADILNMSIDNIRTIRYRAKKKILEKSRKDERL